MLQTKSLNQLWADSLFPKVTTDTEQQQLNLCTERKRGAEEKDPRIGQELSLSRNSCSCNWLFPVCDKADVHYTDTTNLWSEHRVNCRVTSLGTPRSPSCITANTEWPHMKRMSFYSETGVSNKDTSYHFWDWVTVVKFLSRGLCGNQKTASHALTLFVLADSSFSYRKSNIHIFCFGSVWQFVRGWDVLD